MDTQAFLKISYGVYLITSKKQDAYNGMIATTFSQVASEPPTVTVAINKQNLTHEFIKESGTFNACILSQDTPFEFIGKFGFKSGRAGDKFLDTNYKLGELGCPIVLDNTNAYFEVKVNNSVDVGTHTIFIGEVIDAQVLKPNEPLTYAYYHEIKGGKSPKTAPTYIINKK